MSARIVCSGTRPSEYISERLISPPPSRPPHCTLTPCAPERIADASERFIARRKLTRFPSCSAIDGATRLASRPDEFFDPLRRSLLLLPRSSLALGLRRLLFRRGRRSGLGRGFDLRQDDSDVTRGLGDPSGAAARSCPPALHHGALVHVRGGDDELVADEVVVGLGVRDG